MNRWFALIPIAALAALGVFLMIQLVLQAFYRKIGDKLGVQPGC